MMNPYTLPCPPTDDGPGDPVRNFCELARLRARVDGDKISHTFLTDGEAEEAHLTFADIDFRAGRWPANSRPSACTATACCCCSTRGSTTSRPSSG